MTTHNKPYITLDSVVQDYLNESDQSQNKYFKVWHLAFLGFDQLGISGFYQVRTQKIPVNANLTAQLPADYLNWRKVGVLNSRGEIIPLQVNDNLTKFADLSSTRLEQTQDNTLLDWGNNNLWYNYWNGGPYLNIYGVPSGAPFIGSFRIDLNNGVILLDEKFTHYDYVMLEYVASPLEGQEYYLPVQFRQALIAWLWWRDKRSVNINRGQVGISRDLKNDFYNERRLAIAAWKPVRISEMYQASQQQTRMAVKT